MSSPAPAAATAQPGVATAPPMGWNTWYSYFCNINETKVKQATDALVSSGMKDAGYSYVGVDDCWSNGRDAAGNLVADPVKFPSGMKALGDYIHSKGLKFGLYAAPMALTCAKYAGSLDHEQQDANLFASWGVDLLKYDWCSKEGDLAFQQGKFRKMRDALQATGRPIQFNINANSGGGTWTTNAPKYDYSDFAHTARIAEDMSTDWWTSGAQNHYLMGTLNILDLANHFTLRSGPDNWNDWDYVQVGRRGTTRTNEDRAEFTMWAIGGGPLFASNTVTSMTDATKSILTNADVIAVNQSWGGSAGRRISLNGDAEVWAKPLADGSVAVALLNRGTTASITVATTAGAVGLGGSTSYSLKNLWGGATSTSTGAISATVPPKDVAAFRVTRAGTLAAAPAAGTHQVSAMTWLASSNGWGPVEKDQSVGGTGTGDGTPLSINGTTYARGLGTNANSAVDVWLGGSCSQFSAKVGVDDDAGAGRGTVEFAVYGDGKLLASTPVKTQGQAATTMAIPTIGVKALELRAMSTIDGADYDQADWADAKVTCGAGVTSPATRYLSDLTATSSTNGWGPAEKDRSNGESAANDGSPLKIGGVTYAKGLGVHAASDITYPLGGNCSQFSVDVGVDDEVGNNGSVAFEVYRDSTLVTSTGVLKGTGGAQRVTADLSGGQTLRLVVTDGGNGKGSDHADWANPILTCAAGTGTVTRQLSDLAWTSSTNGWGPVERDRSNGDLAANDGVPLKIQGVAYAKGLGTHAASEIIYPLGGNCTSLSVDVGIDDNAGDSGAVAFQIYRGTTLAASTGVLTGTSAAQHLTADLTNGQTLRLVVTDGANGKNYDHADWANAELTCNS
ncbi:MAG TPA: NPCBM/NEW2 domain-containing protein [Actinokineospora sp.]|nr:NPCBM/NEW2 domain-containing protein [Actinokineospora sp.]